MAITFSIELFIADCINYKVMITCFYILYDALFMLFMLICTQSEFNIALLTSIASGCNYSLYLCALRDYALVIYLVI